MNQSEAKSMEQFASNLWENYMSKKVLDLMTNTVKFYRATVDKNDNVSNHILDVSKPFDKSVSVRCTDAVRGANVGDQVLVMQFGEGNATNRVAVAYGDMKSLCAPEYDGLVNAISKKIDLRITPQMEAGWTMKGAAASITGNILRLYFRFSYKETIQPGDFANKKIARISIGHAGRISDFSNAASGISTFGGVASLYTSAEQNDGMSVHFDFNMSSLGIAGNEWSCYMLFPVAINPEKYI